MELTTFQSEFEILNFQSFEGKSGNKLLNI